MIQRRGMEPAARTRAGIAALIAIASACAGTASPRPLVALALPALDGGEIDTRQYAGRVVVIHLFTTWSLGSQADVAALIDARGDGDGDGDDGVVIIGVAMDVDGYRIISPWREVNRIPYLIAIADDALRRGQTSLGTITQVPTTLIVGGDGRLVHRIERALAPGELRRLLAGMRSSK